MVMEIRMVASCEECEWKSILRNLCGMQMVYTLSITGIHAHTRAHTHTRHMYMYIHTYIYEKAYQAVHLRSVYIYFN